MNRSKLSLAVAATLLAASSSAWAVNDVVTFLLQQPYVTGGVTSPSAVGAFSYDPVHDYIYAVGFSGSGQDIRRVEHISDGLTPSVTRLVQATAYLNFTRNGDLTKSGGSPTPGSLVLNPVAIGDIPAYGAAFIADGAAVLSSGTGTSIVRYPEQSQKIYRYNLAADTNGDARDEMTSLVTLKQMQDAISAPVTSTSSNVSRQVALSSDASTVYFFDTSTTFGGLWSVPSLGGTVTRLYADSDGLTEPSVYSVNGADRVVIAGTAASNNVGGLDYWDTADSTRKNLVTGTALATFMQTNTTDISIGSSATDANGNVYFLQTDSSPERRGIYRIDPQGRLIKVASFAERNEVTGGTNSSSLRLQTRTATFTGANGSFPLTQVMFEEPSSLNAIAGAWVFKPGDFNRDNTVTAADFDSFKGALTLKGVAAPLANLKFDANGNGTVDFNDVKVLQSFVGFTDGDANFDFTVGFDDLLSLARNYNGTSKTWLQGDFTGDEAVGFDDLLLLAKNYNATVTPSGSANFSATFAGDWALAQSLVPEPVSATAVLGLIGLVSPRRRRI